MSRKYLQGRYALKQPQKYEGDPTQVIYRSSWELKFFNWCDTNPAVLQWSSEELIIPYICPTDNKRHRYFPDARLRIKTNTGVKTFIVEVKPDAQTRPPVGKRKTKRFLMEVMTWGKNEAKWAAATQYCLDRGYQFVILTEYHLGLVPGHK